jgi:hypothetical protein
MRRGCGRGAGPFPVWGRQGDLGHTPMSRSGRIRLLWRSMCPPANRSRRRMIGLDSRSCLKKGGSTPECVDSEPPETDALGFESLALKPVRGRRWDPARFGRPIRPGTPQNVKRPGRAFALAGPVSHLQSGGRSRRPGDMDKMHPPGMRSRPRAIFADWAPVSPGADCRSPGGGLLARAMGSVIGRRQGPRARPPKRGPFR